jgi:energy-coupling factor transporter ATP-binding protein EcfA2
MLGDMTGAEEDFDNARAAVPATPLEEAPAQWIADDETDRDDGDADQNLKPWSEAVDGAALLDEIAGFVDRYVAMPPGGTDLVTLFVVATFALHRARYDYAPRLMIVGARNSGKSTLIKILAGLCQRPYLSSDISKAPIFQTIDANKPTILIDEVHRVFKEHPDVVSVLQQGWDYHACRTARARGEFNTFAIAILAGIGDYGSTELKSRSAILEMIEDRSEKPPAKFVPRRAAEAMRTLRRKTLRWTMDVREALMDAEPKLPPMISRNRIGDLAEILLRAADVAGGDWPERARNALLTAAANNLDDDEDAPRLLLSAIYEVINNPDLYLHYQDPTDANTQTPRRKACEASFIWTVELVQEIKRRHDLPFDKLTAHAMAKLLRGFRRAPIRPSKLMTGGRGSQTWRGYRRADLENAFALYAIGDDAPAEIPESGIGGMAVENDDEEVILVKVKSSGGKHGNKRYWLTPAAFYKKLDDEFHFDKDPCPNPRPFGYDSLRLRWGKSNYVNPCFLAKDGVNKKGPMAFVRKAIAEQKLGNTSVLVLPARSSTLNLLIAAGAEVRDGGRVAWEDVDTREPMPSPMPVTIFILRGKPPEAAPESASAATARPPDPPPPKRGRGRPPKPKPLVDTPKRPRGRPRKAAAHLSIEGSGSPPDTYSWQVMRGDKPMSERYRQRKEAVVAGRRLAKKYGLPLSGE